MNLTLEKHLTYITELTKNFNKADNNNERHIIINTLINELNTLSNSLVQARSLIDQQ